MDQKHRLVADVQRMSLPRGRSVAAARRRSDPLAVEAALEREAAG
jgi:hypothetical protein